jgi:hypothetical protein
METKIDELKAKILERQEVLIWFTKYLPWFSPSAYTTLANELFNWQIELAELEHSLMITNYKLIHNN